MAKLVWWVKLVAVSGAGTLSEVELAQIERDDVAAPEALGLTLDEGKRLTAATQAEIVRGQISRMGQRVHLYEHCAAKLPSKGRYLATFRSLFGEVLLGSGGDAPAAVAPTRSSQGVRVHDHR